MAYRTSEKTKSEIYFGLLPLLNSNRVELLDHAKLVSQLCNLERCTSRGGRDSVDHPPGSFDDLVNAAAGTLLAAQGRVEFTLDMYDLGIELTDFPTLTTDDARSFLHDNSTRYWQ